MERVVTVHGIWTEGRWQEEIAPVLYPHFEPSSVKYFSYRRLGPLDLVFEPWALLPGLALWAAMVWLVLRQAEGLDLTMAVVLCLGLATLIVGAHLLAPLRLAGTIQVFLDKSAPSILTGRFHVIAHSLGSYIVCSALQDEETMFAQRVVLAGCVVNAKFRWAPVFAQKKLVAVRNEVAGRDLVAWAAKLLRWRFANFGSAGRYGFDNDQNLVHTVPSPNQGCGDAADTARVYNFVSAKKGHSGVLKSTYAKYYWLPFFWEIDPSEFREFLDKCADIIKAYAAAGSPDKLPAAGDFNKLTDEFLQRKWMWMGGTTLETYLSNAGWAVQTPGDLRIVVFNLSLSVAKAQDALGAKIEQWRNDVIARQGWKSREHDEAIKALYPPTAVKRAFIAYLAR